jgi:hypothetical protein
MKTATIVTLVCSFAATAALAQGTVDFDNDSTVDAPIFGPEPCNPTLSQSGNLGPLLAGAGYRAQLFYAPGAGQPESALLGTTVTSFLTGTKAGFVSPITVTLSGVPAGSAATLQVRVWDDSSGSYSTWSAAQTAWQAGAIAAAKSPLFTLLTGGGGVPPKPPALLTGMASFNIYYTSYNFAPPTLLCSNLTVTCGTPIPTNPPAYSDACCTNVVVMLVGGTTNVTGCSGTVSQVWRAVDQCYGTSNTCTRTVTIVPPPKVPLTATRFGPNLVLQWPADATTLTLQSATNLGPSTTWSNVSPTPVVSNGQNTVTNPMSGALRFYRLAQ